MADTSAADTTPSPRPVRYGSPMERLARFAREAVGGRPDEIEAAFRTRFAGPLIGGLHGLGSFDFDPVIRGATFRLCVDGILDGHGQVSVGGGP